MVPVDYREIKAVSVQFDSHAMKATLTFVSYETGRGGDRRRLCQEDADHARYGLGDRTGAATTIRSRDPFGGMNNAESKAVGVGGAGVDRRIGG